MENKNNKDLSPKELYDLKKQAKQAHKPKKTKGSVWRWLVWVILVVVLAGGSVGIYFMIKTNAEKPVIEKTDILAIRTNDWQLGTQASTSTAKVTLVEYSDFACPACATYSKVVSELKKDFGIKLLVVYRHFPLYIHPNAKLAARAAEAAGNQGAFATMAEILFDKQKEWSGQSDPVATFASYAQSLDLDQAKFLADYQNPITIAKVEASLKEAEDLKLTYTPTFFLNGKLIDNPGSYDDFRSLIEKTINE